MNSRKQGDLGTGFAIPHFLSHGYTVCVPLSDSQPYDLIVEKDGTCYRVQVKTCFKKNKRGKYCVELRTVSNTRGKKLEIRQLSKSDFDFLFVLDGDGKMYLFPSSDVDGLRCMTLSLYPVYLIQNNKIFRKVNWSGNQDAVLTQSCLNCAWESCSQPSANLISYENENIQATLQTNNGSSQQ